MQPLLSRRDIFQKSYQNNLTIVKHTFLNGNGICTSACTELIHFSSANRALIKHISTDYIQQHPKRVGQTSKTHELYAPLHTEPFRQTERPDQIPYAAILIYPQEAMQLQNKQYNERERNTSTTGGQSNEG